MKKRGLRKDWQEILNNPKHGDLKLWWIPQIPGKAFEIPVSSVSQAKYILETLAEYDFFQLENRIKPDFCNAGGLVVYDTNELNWVDWMNDFGEGVDELTSEEIKTLEGEQK